MSDELRWDRAATQSIITTWHKLLDPEFKPEVTFYPPVGDVKIVSSGADRTFTGARDDFLIEISLSDRQKDHPDLSRRAELQTMRSEYIDPLLTRIAQRAKLKPLAKSRKQISRGFYTVTHYDRGDNPIRYEYASILNFKECDMPAVQQAASEIFDEAIAELEAERVVHDPVVTGSTPKNQVS